MNYSELCFGLTISSLELCFRFSYQVFGFGFELAMS